MREAVEDVLADALSQAFRLESFHDPRKIIMAPLGLFRISFSQSAAAIPPLKLEHKTDAKPVQFKILNYSKSKRSFLRKFVWKRLDVNLIYCKPTSKWSYAPHPVSKPGSAEWRFTRVLRPINMYTFAEHFRMPLIDEKFDKVAGMKIFCEFDITHGYWPLLLHEDSQECQSFVICD